MTTATPLNATLIQSLWNARAQASGFGRSGFSAALWNLGSRGRHVVQRAASDSTHVVSIWTKGETHSELSLDGKLRFTAKRRRGSFQIARAGESVRAVLKEISGNCLDLYLPVPLLAECAETELEGGGSSWELLPLKLEEDQNVANIGDRIVSELLSPDSLSRIALDGASLDLAVTLIRKYSTIAGRVRPPKAGLAGWQTARVINRMKASIATDVSLYELAAEVSLSPFHFSRSFKKSVGMSPHEYQIHLRMELARNLLVSEDATIGEVARRVGYGDLSYFSRSFRRRYGVTPREFRRQDAM